MIARDLNPSPPLCWTAQCVLERCGLVKLEHGVLLVAQTGSRVYGTFTEASDWDFIVVAEDAVCPSQEGVAEHEGQALRRDGYGDIDLPFRVWEDGVLNLMFIPASVWRIFVRMHRREAVEVTSLPAKHVLYCQDASLLKMQLDLDMLRRTSSWESKLRMQTAASRMRQGDEAKGRKEFFHAIRYKVFAEELSKNDGRGVPDLGCANHFWFDVCSVTDFNVVQTTIQKALHDVGTNMRSSCHPIYTDTLEDERLMMMAARQRRGEPDESCWKLAERACGGSLTRSHCHLSHDAATGLLLVRHWTSVYDPTTQGDVFLAQFSLGIILEKSGSVIARSAPCLHSARTLFRAGVTVRYRPMVEGLPFFVFWYEGVWNVCDGFDVVDPGWNLAHKDHFHAALITLPHEVLPLLRGESLDTSLAHTYKLVSPNHRFIAFRDWKKQGGSSVLVPWDSMEFSREEVLLEELMVRLAKLDPFLTIGYEVFRDGKHYSLLHPRYAAMSLLTPDAHVGPLNFLAAMDASLAVRIAMAPAGLEDARLLYFPEWARYLSHVRHQLLSVILIPMQEVWERVLLLGFSKQREIAILVAPHFFKGEIFRLLKDPLNRCFSIERYLVTHPTVLKSLVAKARDLNLIDLNTFPPSDALLDE